MKRQLDLFILNLMYDEMVEAEYASPNFVADFSFNRGVQLNADDVVFVSNVYGTDQCPTGRADELEVL